MKECKQCKKELVGRSDKQFCGDNCKKKYHYHNDPLIRRARINSVGKWRRSKLEQYQVV